MRVFNRFAVRTSRREILSVLAIWAVLVCAAVAALFLLNRNSISLINHIEYVKAGRYVRMLALYEEARQHADIALEKAGQAPGSRIAPTDSDYAEAVTLYQRALELDPRGTLTPDHSLYYQILMRLHEAAGAEAKALQSMVNDALTRGDFDTAGDYVNRLTALAPGEGESWRLAAEVPLRAGRMDEATTAVARLESVAGPSAALHELRARIARKRGDQPTAIAQYAAAVKLAPEEIDIRKELAGLLSAAGRKEEALQILVEGWKRGGALDGNYMHLLGEALLTAGRAEEAVDALKTAASLEPHSADVQWSLARAHQMAGNPRHAERAMQRAYALNPELRKRALK